MEKQKKKTWVRFEVTKVKLNPEQAVLSCCVVSAGRGQRNGLGDQCMFGCDGGGAPVSQSVDS